MPSASIFRQDKNFLPFLVVVSNAFYTPIERHEFNEIEHAREWIKTEGHKLDSDCGPFAISEAAWQEAYKRVLAGGTTVCEIYAIGTVYTLEYEKGATRLGFISQDREGRIWQYTDSNDQRHELDPSRGGSFRYYSY